MKWFASTTGKRFTAPKLAGCKLGGWVFHFQQADHLLRSRIDEHLILIEKMTVLDWKYNYKLLFDNL